jgi:hypothetical protein
MKIEKKKKVVLCIPTVTRPYQQCLDSIAGSVELLTNAGYEHYMVTEVGNPYISGARASMLRKALDIKADIIIFIDHDVSWKPSDLLKLIETEGDVVAGLYRFKEHPEHYMGVINDNPDGFPIVRKDGCISATRVPAGFLKFTRNTINVFMKAYPHLMYGEACNPSIDIFNHGAHKGAFWGEDYSFSRNWIDCGGEIWVIPDLDLDHHSMTDTYKGNYHQFLMAQPGGSNFKE